MIIRSSWSGDLAKSRSNAGSTLKKLALPRPMHYGYLGALIPGFDKGRGKATCNPQHNVEWVYSGIPKKSPALLA